MPETVNPRRAPSLWLPALACLALLLLAAGCSSPAAREAPSAPQKTAAATLTAASAPAVPVVGSILALNGKFQYDDNFRKQIVSVSLRNTKVRSQYYYYFNDVVNPEILRHDANPGTQMLLAGVTFDLVGIHGEGSRTRFMIPLASSFVLWRDGTLYESIDPRTLDNPLHYYIKDEGSLYIDRWIERDQPGTGILVFEVPPSFTQKGTFLRFCPENDPSWIARGISPRSPDTWNCDEDGVAWRLG